MKNIKSISLKTAAILSTIVLLLSLVPIIAISIDNSPFYDDYGYTIQTHEEWINTHNIWSTLKKAIQNVLATRNTWEANYSNTFLHSFQPTVFGENYYWISTVIILLLLLGSIACFLRLTVITVLKGSKAAFWCVFSGVSLIAVQFVPCAKETFFWHSGGMAYTVLWAFMVIRFCFLIRLQFYSCGKKSIVFDLITLSVLTIIVGGAKFSTSLPAILLDACILFFVFTKNTKYKWFHVFYELLLAALFVTCITGQGNAVRAQTLTNSMNPIKAIAESFYFGIGLLGSWCNIRTIPLILITIVILAPLLVKTTFRFRFPALVSTAAVCLFCAQLAPTVYTGLYIGDGRVINTYYFTFLLMSTAVALYWTGWTIQRFPRIKAWFANNFNTCTLSHVPVILTVIFLIIGTISWKPDGAQSYGPQNTVSGSSLRSLYNGEAKEFHQRINERMALLKDADQTDVELTLIPDSPFVFMGDSLDIENQEYVLHLFTEYFHKHSVTLKKEE